MKARKRLLTIALTAALGLGVWTLAISFTAASFSDGDILSAAALNNLLNGNFDAAEAEFAALDSAKFDKTGGTITGRTDISGAASSSGSGDVTTIFRANNTGSSGSAAVFQSSNDSDAGAVTVKQGGVGPALTLKSNGGGPLISGAGSLMVTFLVEDNGSIKIGELGGDGTGAPSLHLNAVDGTITNSVGSGLPLAFGFVSAAGVKISGTSNFQVETVATGTFHITFSGETYDREGFATVVQGISPGRFIARTDSAGGKLVVETYNTGHALQSSAFHFVTYKDGL